jgi:peptidoglycan/xylan/chitin deacetylase (PgdA/CDA1 family)
VLLSFDAEEFDLPLERGQRLSLDEQMAVGGEGLRRTLALLDEVGPRVRATFFCTAVFAERFPELIARAVSSGHEIASHGVVHGAADWRDEHLLESRQRLERVSGTPCVGFRRPRLAPTDPGLIAAAGYRYNSGENPTWLSGRYNNFFRPRRPHRVSPPTAPAEPASPGLLNIPASVTPVIRWPLFWLSFKAAPLSLTRAASAWVLRADPALVLYFHPWELCDLSAYRVPAYVRACDGQRMRAKLAAYLRWLAERAGGAGGVAGSGGPGGLGGSAGGGFMTYADFERADRARPGSGANHAHHA